MIPFTELERAIFDCLDTRGGMLVRDIAALIPRAVGTSKAQHSQRVRACLEFMEMNGRVRRLDGEKPPCWIRAELEGWSP